MIELIPAIDIIDGKCVRLSQGDYDTKKIYNENPLEVAKEFEANGIQRLHVVDLDGAKSSHVVNYKVLDAIAGHTSLTIDFGGGIKTGIDCEAGLCDLLSIHSLRKRRTHGNLRKCGCKETGAFQEMVAPIRSRENHFGCRRKG